MDLCLVHNGPQDSPAKAIQRKQMYTSLQATREHVLSHVGNLPQLHTKRCELEQPSAVSHSKLQERENYATQSNLQNVHPNPRVLLLGHPGVTQCVPHLGQRGGDMTV